MKVKVKENVPVYGGKIFDVERIYGGYKTINSEKFFGLREIEILEEFAEVICEDEIPKVTKQNTGTTEEANHYMTSKQPIEIIQELMTPEQFQGFLWGNVIKYSMRLNRKGKNREDAGKCWQYAKWMCEAMDGLTIVPGGK